MTTMNSENPNPQLPTNQLQPDFKYLISTSADTGKKILANVFVVGEGKTVTLGPSGSQMNLLGKEGGTEYWFYSNVSRTIESIESASAIEVQREKLSDDYPRFDPTGPNLDKNESTADKLIWGKPQAYNRTAASRGMSYSFWSNKPGGDDKCFGLELVVNTKDGANGRFLCGIQWYQYDKDASMKSGPMVAPEFSRALEDEKVWTWNKGENWTGLNPYDHDGYFAQTSMWSSDKTAETEENSGG